MAFMHGIKVWPGRYEILVILMDKLVNLQL